jgi:hypothetical protein
VDGPRHWREADQILTEDPCEYGCPHSGCEHETARLRRGQVHAQLAATAFAATAELVKLGALPVSALDAWRDVTAEDEEAAPEAAGEK